MANVTVGVLIAFALLGWACRPTALETRNFGKDCYRAPVEGRAQVFFTDGLELPQRCQKQPLTESVQSTVEASAIGRRDSFESESDAGLEASDGGRAGALLPAVKPFSEGCSEERVKALFARSFEQGGCQDPGFAGCHGTDSDDTAPNLLALDLRAELVGRRIAAPPEGIHECNQELVARGGRELSLLWQKAAGEPPCGDAMPPDEVARAPASELACLGEWIDRLALGY